MKYSESNPLPLMVAAKGIMATVAGTLTQGTSIGLDLAQGDTLGTFLIKDKQTSYQPPSGQSMAVSPEIAAHVQSFLKVQDSGKLSMLATIAQSLEATGKADVAPPTTAVRVMDSIRSMLG